MRVTSKAEPPSPPESKKVNGPRHGVGAELAQPTPGAYADPSRVRSFSAILDARPPSREAEPPADKKRESEPEEPPSEKPDTRGESPTSKALPARPRDRRGEDEGDESGAEEGAVFETEASFDVEAESRYAAAAAAAYLRADEAVAGAEWPSARSILQAPDLEQIVSAVRTQVLLDGRRQVSIELSKSVLEGLCIRLSLNAAGELAAEFITGSEQVRRQIDARSTELAEMMRSRGINLASLKTSSDAASTQGGDPGHQGGGHPSPHARALSRGTGSRQGRTAEAAEAADEETPVSPGGGFRGYRA